MPSCSCLGLFAFSGVAFCSRPPVLQLEMGRPKGEDGMDRSQKYLSASQAHLLRHKRQMCINIIKHSDQIVRDFYDQCMANGHFDSLPKRVLAIEDGEEDKPDEQTGPDMTAFEKAMVHLLSDIPPFHPLCKKMVLV